MQSSLPSGVPLSKTLLPHAVDQTKVHMHTIAHILGKGLGHKAGLLTLLLSTARIALRNILAWSQARSAEFCDVN